VSPQSFDPRDFVFGVILSPRDFDSRDFVLGVLLSPRDFDLRDFVSGVILSQASQQDFAPNDIVTRDFKHLISSPRDFELQ
jgi:hypothetical protein